jgi:hypothetical protein
VSILIVFESECTLTCTNQLCDCSGVTIGEAWEDLGAKFLVVADAPLRKPGCMVECGLQEAFQSEKFGRRLWRVAGAGSSGTKARALDPVYVFITYLLVEASKLGPGGVVEWIQCKGIRLRVMHTKRS